MTTIRKTFKRVGTFGLHYHYVHGNEENWRNRIEICSDGLRTYFGVQKSATAITIVVSDQEPAGDDYYELRPSDRRLKNPNWVFWDLHTNESGDLWKPSPWASAIDLLFTKTFPKKGPIFVWVHYA